MTDKPKLVYVAFIMTTPAQLWKALTDPKLTAQYWGHRNVSGWKIGDSWEHQRLSDGGSDGGGRITEIDPPRRLAHTWGATGDADNPDKLSRVTFELEPAGEFMKLTVTHEELPPEQVEDTREGWAIVVSSLKSFLETGRPLTALVQR
jgi:uncharacterized protein YndB with AHSA1/START domain